MDTGRLGEVRRHENSNRKFMCILNHMVKSRWETMNDSLSRERNEMDVKLEKAGTLWRRKYVQQRVLQQCLKMRKTTLANSSTARLYGSYGGKPLYAYSRDIERFITDNHPKKRRQRKVKRALLESIERGKIIDPKELPGRVDKYFSVWKEKEESSKPSSKLLDFETGGKTFKNTVIPPIRGLVNNFHKFTLDDSEEDSAQKQENKGDNSDVILIKTDNNDSNNSEDNRTDSRRVLKLPPVQTSKAMVAMSRA
ncbi:uncharacterized protein LOC125681732 [Ostrea edulis]|uniref:uncharacterized protein LOC125681732 n=1 Tax=Ostrea edulis TaxID=37623 RepID=UPI002095ED1C|nr:uncharacterized protein LOC125681732 [Ostrea edulis]XP_048777890.1 uncharacterized protein LOC125681732 [Ostrea edulis]XP_048777891.1 uncharacterized protein LOC125681732 [Ostrea edulis]XP_048777892.1 uncharacterized protein LOC125681732 [Ostrea edulis]XP_048777893.1 uncharacterized protein LOC125681732 [Ostrea edulis]XP_056011261.1 uncharacterized protein LOC125681732 [Ostrea edulis]XP_056011262.1 uncharacterized protein LOC125681732 [Ostrea edulis]